MPLLWSPNSTLFFFLAPPFESTYNVSNQTMHSLLQTKFWKISWKIISLIPQASIHVLKHHMKTAAVELRMKVNASIMWIHENYLDWPAKSELDTSKMKEEVE